MKPTTFAECMDIFDWFNDPLYDYLSHILLSKMDGEARITRALPNIISYADKLLLVHAGTEAAYPAEPLNQPA